VTDLAPTRTTWTTPSLLDAYATAWAIVIGGQAPRIALAILFSQATLECGHGGQSCWNHNVGNIMAFASWTGDAHVLRGAPECFPVGKVPLGWTEQPSNIACGPGKVSAVPAKGSRFRAYASFVEGCTDKLRVLSRQWPGAIDALKTATDATAVAPFVAGLVKPSRYFTASEVAYASTIRSLVRNVMAQTTEAEWPAVDAAPDTQPQTPTSRSSQRLRAVNADILDWSPQTSAHTVLPNVVPLVDGDDWDGVA
jgi:hypothetical protein